MEPKTENSSPDAVVRAKQEDKVSMAVGEGVNYYEMIVAEHLAIAHVEFVQAVNSYLQSVERRRENAKLDVQTAGGVMSITKIVERTYASMIEKLAIVRAYEAMLETTKGDNGDVNFRNKVDEIAKLKPLEFDLSAVQ